LRNLYPQSDGKFWASAFSFSSLAINLRWKILRGDAGFGTAKLKTVQNDCLVLGLSFGQY
jgi:hypothetical protein